MDKIQSKAKRAVIRKSVLAGLLGLAVLVSIVVLGDVPDALKPFMSGQPASPSKRQTTPPELLSNAPAEKLPLTGAEVGAKMAKMGIPFIPNQGQVDERVKFYANTFGGTVFVTKEGEIVYSLQKVEGNESAPHPDLLSQSGKGDLISNLQSVIRSPQSINTLALKEELVGGKVKEVKGEGAAATKVSYFSGNDESKWKRDISTYDSVSLGEVYEGVEVNLKAHGNNVEKFFYVKPGTSPESVKIKLSGGKLGINNEGELEVSTQLGAVRFSKPVAYQDGEGKTEYVQVAYAVDGDEYGFRVGEYDRGKELVIDPALVSTFLGGSGQPESIQPESITGIDLDSVGNVYVAGFSDSSDFPCIGTSPSPATCEPGITPAVGSGNLFVVKLDSDLSTILAATFLDGFIGGSFRYPTLAVDGFGNVFVTGETTSAGFPGISMTSADSTLTGEESFIVKLNSDLDTILAATFVGGSGNEPIRSIALDDNGNVFVAGTTTSSDFPCIGSSPANCASGLTPADSDGNFFAAKFDPNLSTILGATFIGQLALGNSVAVNSTGVYVSGILFDGGLCEGDPLPNCASETTPAIDPASKTGVVVAKLDSDLSTILAGTFVSDLSGFIRFLLSNAVNFPLSDGLVALDGTGNVYVAGYIDTASLPCVQTSLPTCASGITPADDLSETSTLSETFVLKFDPNLSSILAATFVGGKGSEFLGSIVVDDTGEIYVAGLTGSSDFPCIGASPANCAAGITPADGTFAVSEAFVAKLNPSLSLFLYSTYLGGSSFDGGVRIFTGYMALGSTSLYFADNTKSSDFPGVGPGSADVTFATSEAFVSKLDTTDFAEDTDDDGLADSEDNCPMDANPDQADADGDGIGDVCDACPNDPQNDADGDGICGDVDNCPMNSNPGQEDSDGDGVGDVCDACANDPQNDSDSDGVCGDVDNCPMNSNPGQEDSDGDDIGDVCDAVPFGSCAGLALTEGCRVNNVPDQLCQGTPGKDTIIGTAGDDVIAGMESRDTLSIL